MNAVDVSVPDLDEPEPVTKPFGLDVGHVDARLLLPAEGAAHVGQTIDGGGARVGTIARGVHGAGDPIHGGFEARDGTRAQGEGSRDDGGGPLVQAHHVLSPGADELRCWCTCGYTVRRQSGG